MPVLPGEEGQRHQQSEGHTPDIAEMWCTEKNFEIGLTKGPESVLAESEGFCRVENDEGRVWEVLIRKAVKEEGLPVPPPLRGGPASAQTLPDVVLEASGR